MNRQVPFREIAISTLKSPAMERVSLILAYEAFNHYTVKTINHTPEEPHDAKHQTAHHRG